MHYTVFVKIIVIFDRGMVVRIACSSEVNALVKCFVMFVICYFSGPAILPSSRWTMNGFLGFLLFSSLMA